MVFDETKFYNSLEDEREQIDIVEAEQELAGLEVTDEMTTEAENQRYFLLGMHEEERRDRLQDMTGSLDPGVEALESIETYQPELFSKNAKAPQLLGLQTPSPTPEPGRGEETPEIQEVVREPPFHQTTALPSSPQPSSARQNTAATQDEIIPAPTLGEIPQGITRSTDRVLREHTTGEGRDSQPLEMLDDRGGNPEPPITQDVELREVASPEKNRRQDLGQQATQETPSSSQSQDSSTIEPTRRSSRIQTRKEEGKGQDWKRLKKRNFKDVNSFWVEYLDQPSAGRTEIDHEFDYNNYKTVFSVLGDYCERKPPKATKDSNPEDSEVRISTLPPPPTNWKQLQNHPLKEEFTNAMEKEIDSLKSKGTWEVIDREEATTRPLPMKWVFTYKEEEGVFKKCKARICVRGDLQETSTIVSTYAATPAAHTFRLFIALAAHFDLEMKQFDVKSAFLNAFRDESTEPVVCEFPDGFKQHGKYVKLVKALYGLRDSPQLWYQEFAGTLRSLGMSSSGEEPCLFYNPQRTVFLILFVDDFLVFYRKKDEALANQVIKGIKEAYDIEDKGDAEYFLGIQITRDRKKRKIFLSHQAYIEKFAAKFGLREMRAIPTIPLSPLPLSIRLDKATSKEIKEFQEMIGTLLYAAIMIRPDVALASAKLSQHATNPGPEHRKAVLNALLYLVATAMYSLQFGGDEEKQVLLLASDASFADDEETRKSSQGYIITLFGGPIIWKATKQRTVTTSTTEAELLALQHLAKEVMALKRLFRDIHLNLGGEWNLLCDNLQTIRLIKEENIRFSTQLKHIDVHRHWVREQYQANSFDISYIPSAEMPADGLTKALPRQSFERFRSMLNMVKLSVRPSKDQLPSPPSAAE